MYKKFKFKKRYKIPKSEYDSADRVLNKNTDFETIEAYKSMRTNIMFSIPKSDKGKIITVTSSLPGEGKTTTSINLAITFAQMGAKVLLMDCDLRKARVHRYLNLERKAGLTNVICGFVDFDKAVKRDVRENLDVLTSGEIPSNPAELLENEEFENMIHELQKQYDYIFIDTPPVTVVTDAAVVMKHSMGVIVVVRQNVTTYDYLDVTMMDIRRIGIKILGMVLLGTDEGIKKYGYYRRKKYKYKYGNKYGYKYKYGYNYGYKYGDDVEENK
jgi:capsular exopolysaccharide synthesis family protein